MEASKPQDLHLLATIVRSIFARHMLEVLTEIYSAPTYNGGQRVTQGCGYLGGFESLVEDWTIKNCPGRDLLVLLEIVHLRI